MIIEILDLAEQDILDGFLFYEAQQAGLGAYFLTNIYADIESLRLNAGIHHKDHKITTVSFLNASLSLFSTN